MLLAIVTFAVTASMPQIDSVRLESGWGGLDTYRIVLREDEP
ncbi:MAG TPA: hypothetical protein VJ901_16785 [Thermoanaerobaculia bacterium]|nr:hypothetical protein [Thermoanaerobaculia bacterium]